MDRSEIVKTLSYLRVAYPEFYRGITPEDAEATISLWLDMFREEESALVGAAVKAFVATDTRGYPPKVGMIREQLQKLTASEEMSELEAWETVRRALKNAGYRSREEFEKLPEVIRRIVGSPSTLFEWSMMKVDQLETVTASNFMRSYKAISVKAKEYAALPACVKELASSIADTKRLGQVGMDGHPIYGVIQNGL